MDFGDQLSIFGDLFTDPVVPAAKTKAQKKTEKKDPNKKALKKVQLPVTINLLGFKPFILTEEMAEGNEIEEEKIVKIIREKETWLPDALSYEDKSLRFSGVVTEKGAADVSRMFFGPEEIDLGGLPEEKRETAELVAYVKTQTPKWATVVTGLYTSKGTAYVIPQAEGAKAVRAVKIPEEELLLHTLWGEIIPLKRDELIALAGVEEEDITEDTEVKTADLVSFLPEWLRGAAAFGKANKENELLVVCKGRTPEVHTPAKTTYDIKGGAVISLYFIKYTLDPEEFGKDKLLEEDIRAFLVQKGHVEYGFPDTGVVITPYTDKKDGLKYLLVSTRGSKKGAGDHPFFELGANGFTWTGPKVPLYMLGRFVIVARLAVERWKSEILMELFFHRGEYFWHIPYQKVHLASVKSWQEPWLENSVTSGAIKVGEWHSHGSIQAFFSSVDNADETFPGLYGVIGGLGKDVPSFTWRAVTADRVEELDKSLMGDVFDDNCTEDPDPWGFLEYVLSVFRTIDQELTSYPLYESPGGKALLMEHPQALFWERFEVAEVIRNQNGSSFLAAPGFKKESAAQTRDSCTVSRFLFDAIM